MVRRALVALTALLALAAPAAAHVDQGAAPSSVLILKGKPVPATRIVPLRGSATWLNGDKAAHRIASDKRAWPAFVLRRGNRRSVRFDRVGRYPYKVDGKAKGVIVVTAGGGGAGGGGLGTTLIHYDVHVTGHAQSIRTYTGETRADRNGVETLNIDWDSKFTNVTLKKLAASGVFVIGPQSGRFARGRTTANYGFKETRGDFYGPCQGTVTFTLGTHLLLSGSRASGRNSFIFWSQLDLEEGTRMVNEMTKQACANHLLNKTEPGWSGPDIVVGGLTYTPFNSLLELHAERKDTAASLWFPLNRLVNAAPFTIDTGDVDRAVSCGSNCQAQYHLRLLADVTRHR